MARHLGDMVDGVEEIGVAGDIGRPAILAVSGNSAGMRPRRGS
jgi:hypothetical protein